MSAPEIRCPPSGDEHNFYPEYPEYPYQYPSVTEIPLGDFVSPHERTQQPERFKKKKKQKQPSFKETQKQTKNSLGARGKRFDRKVKEKKRKTKEKPEEKLGDPKAMAMRGITARNGPGDSGPKRADSHAERRQGSLAPGERWASTGVPAARGRVRHHAAHDEG